MKATRGTGWKHWQVDTAGLGACLAATVAMYLLGIQPLRQGHEQFLSQQQALTDQRQKAADSVTRLRGLQRQLDQAHQTLRDSPVQLQSAHQINQRLASLTTLANACGLRIDDIQPGAPAPGARYDTVPIRLGGLGNYRACAQFLHQLHQTHPDMATTAFDLTGTRGDAAKSATFRFSLVWYAAPSPRAAQR